MTYNASPSHFCLGKRVFACRQAPANPVAQADTGLTEVGKQWLRLLPFFLLVLALGCGKAPEAAEEEPGPAPVEVVKAQKMSVGGWTELPGATQPLPQRVARVTAAVEGRVLSLLPEHHGTRPGEGDRVEAGQVIVQLDDEIARQNLATAKASLKDLAAQVAQAETAVESAQLKFTTAERLQQTRLGNTAGTGEPLTLGSRVNLEEARIALQDAKQKQQAAEAKLTSGQAAVRVQEAQLRFYTLRAPIAGHLGIIQVVPGQTLSVGNAVADIIDLDEIDVLCFVPPSRIGEIALNQTADLVPLPGPPAGKPRQDQGKVVFIAVQAQSQTGSFPVKVRFPNKDLHLRASALVRVRIETEPVQQRLVVPETALLEDQEPPRVVVVEDVKSEEKEGKKEQLGKARLLEAVTGVRDRDKHLVEIIGLEDSEKKKPVPPLADVLFVVKGSHGLEDGDAVKIEEEEHKEEK